MAAVDRLTPEQAAALIDVTVEDFLDGGGKGARKVRRIRVKLANTIDAFELLGKHHELYVERHEHDRGQGTAARLDAALKRVDAWEEADHYYQAHPEQRRAARHARMEAWEEAQEPGWPIASASRQRASAQSRTKAQARRSVYAG